MSLETSSGRSLRSFSIVCNQTGKWDRKKTGVKCKLFSHVWTQEDMENSVNTNLRKLFEGLSSDLDRDDFQSFSRREISLRNARRQWMFKSDYDGLLSQVNEKFRVCVRVQHISHGS
jgi:hypothetical protein